MYKRQDDEIPFDIPEGWEWARLGNIVYQRAQLKPTSAFSYIDIGSIDNAHQRLSSKETLIEADKAPSRARKPVKLGDVLYSTVRPYLQDVYKRQINTGCSSLQAQGARCRAAFAARLFSGF